MPDTDILNQEQVVEIDARKPFYFCDRCGHFGETGPTHYKPGSVPGSIQWCNYSAMRPSSELTIDALCRTLRVAWKERDDALSLLENSIAIELQNTALREQLAEARQRYVARYAALQQINDAAERERQDAESQLAQVEKEREWFSKQCENLQNEVRAEASAVINAANRKGDEPL